MVAPLNTGRLMNERVNEYANERAAHRRIPRRLGCATTGAQGRSGRQQVETIDKNLSANWQQVLGAPEFAASRTKAQQWATLVCFGRPRTGSAESSHLHVSAAGRREPAGRQSGSAARWPTISWQI